MCLSKGTNGAHKHVPKKRKENSKWVFTLFWLDFLRVNWNIGQPGFLIVLHLINSPPISFKTWSGLSWGSRVNLGVSKKTKKPIKPKKQTVKKNSLKFWKDRPIQFGFNFINLKPKKLNPNRKNRAKPVFVKKNWTEPKPVGLNQFRFFYIKKFQFSYFFW